MKCAAEAVIKNERYNFQHRQYGELFLDYSETAAVYCACAEYKSLREVSEIQKMLDDISDWMIDAVTGAIPDSIRMKDGGKSWWAYDTEREDDAISYVLSRWTMDFQSHGFRDVALMQLEPGPIPEYTGWAAADVLEARTARIEYMTVRGRDAIRLFTLCFCCWMAEQVRGEKHRFSPERVDEKIYPVYAAEMKSFQARFLSGDRGAMDKLKRRLADMKREISARYGIELGEVGQEKGGTPRTKPDSQKASPGGRLPQTKPDSPKASPEKGQVFENLMRGTEGFSSVLKYR